MKKKQLTAMAMAAIMLAGVVGTGTETVHAAMSVS